MALTWYFESLSMPIFWAMRSIFLVETPFARFRDGRRDGLVGVRVALDYPLGEVGADPQLGYAQDDVADGGRRPRSQ